jgi:adenylate cyclase
MGIGIKNIFDRHFRHETLESERLREFILAGAVLLLTVGLTVNLFFLSNDYHNKVPELIRAFEWILLLFLFIILRSFIVRLIIKKSVKAGKQLPAVTSYINAFIEVSVPSAAIIILSIHIEPITALVSPLLLLYFLFIILSSLELDPRLSLFTGFIAAVEYILISFYYITETDATDPILGLPVAFLVRGGILFVSGIIAGIVSYQIRKRILTTYKITEERNELEKIFGQQVSKEIVDDFISNKMKIENRTREACIMFLDIRDFSKYCEGKSPGEINKYQNSVLGFMIDAVKKHKGIVNQILGDGFMATYGAPIEHENDCQSALDTANEILHTLERKIKNNEIPETKIRIGINAGTVVTGNVGTENRKQFSITGNAVIIAARLEQLNKEFNSTILVSKEVYDKINIDGKPALQKHLANLKGQSEPVEVYQVV